MEIRIGLVEQMNEKQNELNQKARLNKNENENENENANFQSNCISFHFIAFLLIAFSILQKKVV